MLLSERDLAREIQRQLVEFVSIRKRVKGDPELLARIEKLEASHLYILRKLSEGLEGAARAKPRRRRACLRASRGRILFEAAMARQSRSLEGGCCGAADHAASAAGIYLSRASGATELPRLDERCAACGKVLISSILAGEDVVRAERARRKTAHRPKARVRAASRGEAATTRAAPSEAWCHARCVKKGKPFAKPGLLN
jgi:hypothetical protein